MEQERRICDYEGSAYRSDFWEGQGREYEDLAERIALRRLMPGRGHCLLDVGAGFARLSEFYRGYDRVVLLDYSRSLLRQAQARLGRDDRFVYVAANLYNMPFATGAFHTVMMVRVMHHVEHVPALLRQVARVLSGTGTYILEFANKRHLKAILRYLLRRQHWSPFELPPYEFVEMNFDFHPRWMQDRLAEAGFHVKHRLTVSHFRLPLLKRFVPARLLASLDGACQPSGAWWQLTPSVFLSCIKSKPADLGCAPQLFRCLLCGSEQLTETSDSLRCDLCSGSWPIEDGIYNLKMDPAV